MWIAASALFSFYVTNFGSYNETFGSLAAVVILLIWLFLSAYVVCFGAELNAELERQTARDTTVGPPKRRGRRGAYVADHSVSYSDADQR
jgi:membrane protein